jgi:hypothetical protein
MDWDTCVLIWTAIMASFAAGAVWLAQISGYPLWPLVGRGEFRRFYAAWARGARSTILVPLLLALAGAAGALWLGPKDIPAWALWLGFGLQLTLAVLTLSWWSPPASRILAPGGGLDPPAHARLQSSHWLRVALVTVHLALACWMVAHHPWTPRLGQPQASQWLLLATVALGFYAAGQIWMVQSLCYRLWPLVGRETFFDYHMAWWRSIWTVIFVPSGLTLAGAVALLWLRPPEVDPLLLRAGLGLQVLLYLLTAAWWGPLMSRLATREQGLLARRYRLMTTTHWLRVAIVSGYALVALRDLLQTLA